MSDQEVGASASGTGPAPSGLSRDASQAKPPVPDAERGPEWAEMEARHERQGVVRWHADRMPGVTDEQLAAEMNRVDRWLSVPENNVASRLRGEAFCLAGDAMCTLNAKYFDGTDFVPVELTSLERIQAKSKQQLANLLVEAAVLLEGHAIGTSAREGQDAQRLGVEDPQARAGTASPEPQSGDNHD